MKVSEPPTYRAELYLRDDTYGTYDAQRRVVERVRALETHGHLAEAPVDRWTKIRTRNGDSRPETVETFREFEAWADSNGFSLEPAFQRRTGRVLGTADVYGVVSFPVISLALYDDEDLLAVFPCSEEDEDEHYRVGDCLDAFEANLADSWLSSTFQTVPVERTEPHMEARAGV